MQLKTCSALLAGALAIYAADFWNAKDPAQWTPEEIESILNDSPWARPTNISFDLPGMQPDSGKSRSGRFAGDGGYKGGAYPRRGRYPDEDEPAKATRGLPSFVATVRWESALPIRQALLKSQPAGSVEPSENSYVIAVLGVPIPGSRAEQTAERKGPPPRDPESVRYELLASTKLIRKNKTPIAPSDVKIDSSKSAGEIHFFFPRKDPISVDDKELTFEMQLGAMKLDQKFRLKDMTLKKKLEL